VAAAFLSLALVLHVINEGAGTGSVTDGLEEIPTVPGVGLMPGDPNAPAPGSGPGTPFEPPK